MTAHLTACGVILATVFAGATLAEKPYGPKPVPADGPRRDADFGAALLAYHRRTLVDVYLNHGTRDAQWDKPAQSLLEGLAARFANAPGAPEYADLEEDANTCAALACPDTLVTYGRACVLAGQGRWPEALPLLRTAMERFGTESNIPASRKMTVPERLAGHYFGNGATRGLFSDRWLDQWLALALESTSDGSFLPGEEPVFVHLATGALEAWQRWGYDPDELWGVLARELDQKQGVDAWTIQMMRGLHHDKKGWQMRSRPWNPTVGDEGWRGFGSQMQQAHEAFVVAHLLHPDRPEAARRLIAIAKAGHALPGETPRYWFDRAVEATFDDIGSYMELVDALRPRWGGSREALLAFGDECLATQRFDTNIPAVMGEVIRALSLDREHPADVYQDPGIYRRARNYLTGIIASPNTRDPMPWRARLLVAAYWSGDKQTALEQARLLGPQFRELNAQTRPFEVDLEQLTTSLSLPAGFFEESAATQAEK